MSTAQPTVRPTKKQRALLDYIEAFINQHGYSPSYREIMNGCGYTSIATVAVHINNLIERGHLRKRDHSARSLELTGGNVETDSEASNTTGEGVRWLSSQLEALFKRAESAEADIAGHIKDARVLLDALRVLRLEAEVQQFTPRLQALQVRVEEEDDVNGSNPDATQYNQT